MTGGPGAEAWILIWVSVLLAGWSLVLLVINRPIGRAFRIAGFAFCGLMAAFALLRMILLGQASPQASVAMIIGYLLAGILIPVGALWWTRTDASRAGSGVMLVAYLAASVVILRVGQAWVAG